MRMLAIMAMWLTFQGAWAASESREFSRRVAAGARDRISISNIAGAVRLTAWERPEVDVQGKLGSGVERVEVSQHSGEIEIRVVVHESGLFGIRSVLDPTAFLDVRVPAGSELEVHTVSALISGDALRGRAELKSVSGGIRVAYQGAELDAKTVSGAIDVNGVGQRIRLQAVSVSGGIRVDRVSGEIEAKSTSGSVRISSGLADKVELKTVSGSIVYGGRLSASGELDAEAVSGSVQVIAASDAGYAFDVSSYSGAIRSCFGDVPQRKSPGRSGKHLSGSQGQGSARVRLRSMSGGVSLCDR